MSYQLIIIHLFIIVAHEMGPGFSVRSTLSVCLSWGVAPREMRFCRGTFVFLTLMLKMDTCSG